MLQILGEVMMIATRTDGMLYDARRDYPRPQHGETESQKTRRKGWLRVSGFFL